LTHWHSMTPLKRSSRLPLTLVLSPATAQSAGAIGPARTLEARRTSTFCRPAAKHRPRAMPTSSSKPAATPASAAMHVAPHQRAPVRASPRSPHTEATHTVRAPAARRAAVAGALTVLPPTLVNATNMIAPRARPQTHSSSSGTANACSSPSRPTRGPPSTTSPTGSAPERTTGWAHPPARAGSGSPRASPPRHPLPRRRHRHRACPRSGRPRAC
jgi:hypothetical protein